MAGIVEVDGGPQLRRTLKAIGSDLGDLKAVHNDVAAYVTEAARGRAPVRTGRLAGTLRGTGAKTVATVRAGYAKVPYAGPIHWGWGRRGIRSNPFLTLAAAETEPVWVEIYTAGVQGLIDVDISRHALLEGKT